MRKYGEYVFPTLVATCGALVILLGTEHPATSPNSLKALWAFGIYLALPLSVAILLDSRRKLLPYLLGAAGGLVILAPLVLRSYLNPGKIILATHPEYLAYALGAGLVLVLAAAWAGRVDLREWGLGPGNWRWWVPRTLLLLALIVPLVLLAALAFPQMREYYPVYKPARECFGELLKYQAWLGFYMIGWEFFFRGFLLFGMARRGGPVFATLFQAIPFFLMHSGKPEAEMISSFAGAILLGYLCYRGRSFWPAFGLHWALNFSMEVVGFLW